jgi:hypothetical protein
MLRVGETCQQFPKAGLTRITLPAPIHHLRRPIRLTADNSQSVLPVPEEKDAFEMTNDYATADFDSTTKL